MAPRRKCKRPLEARERRGAVEAKGAPAGQSEEAQGRDLQLRRLLGLVRRPRQLERGRVVVGKNVGEVPDAVRDLVLDPGGGGHVPSSADGACELLVGDIADEGMPKRVLG